MINNSMRTFITITTLLVTCTLLSSCSVRFVYNQADLLVPWYIKSYIQLNEGQSHFVKKRLNYHLRWHRRTQLPEYADLLLRATPVIFEARHEPRHNPATPPEASQPTDNLPSRLTNQHLLTLKTLQQEMTQLSHRLSERIAPDLAELFLTASEAQRLDIYERFEKDNQRYREKYLDTDNETQKALAYEEMRPHIERWIGSMTADQTAYLKTWSERTIPIHQHILTYRIRWQQRFKDLLNWHHTEHAEIKADLIELFARPNQGWHPDHQAILTHNQTVTLQLLAEIQHSLTKKQRRKASKKAHKLAKSFKRLASE